MCDSKEVVDDENPHNFTRSQILVNTRDYDGKLLWLPNRPYLKLVRCCDHV